MEIGFIGLGKMGFPMARRLIEAGHQLVVFDQRKEAVDQLRHMAKEKKVTFIYAAHDQEHNGALALKTYLEQRKH